MTSKKLLQVIITVLLLPLQLLAQQITFIVKDRQTGFAVPGATVNVTSANGKAGSLQAAKNGKALFDAGTGRYDFSISAPGYQTLSTYFVTGPDRSIEAHINLDPVVTAAITEARQWPVRKDQLMISGYVRDADENTPLAGAQVSAGAYTAVSDSKGFFAVTLPASTVAITEGKTPPAIAIGIAKSGYAAYTIQNFYAIPDEYTLKIALTAAGSPRLKQQPGTTPEEETEVYKHGLFDRTAADEEQRYAEPTAIASVQKNEGAAAALAVAVPGTIRVGTSCSCTSCSVVQVMSLEAYTQTGLDDEWIASWGAASLQAGAVAYRTYGAWYVLHPVASSYDIAATTCNQAWQNDVATSTKNAAIATAGTVLLKNGAIFRSEYSSENNNSGCGNGYSGTGTSWPCISDPRCAGRTKFGHGRGMCQYGSSFWASDKTYLWILDHYYTPGGVSVQLPPAPGVTRIAFTVKDQNAGTAIASATISATKVGGATTTLTTNASGQAVFGADTGRYNVTISKSGYNSLTTFFIGSAADDSIAADVNLDVSGSVVAVPGVPATIRVATSCACTTPCSSLALQVMSLEAYVQTGLDDEWVSSWNAPSLQAGAVAYRSRGAWYVQHPFANNYDLSAAACHQTWQNDRAAGVKNAAIATAGVVLVKNGAIIKADYAAENNNAGCGDGFSGNGTTWACISDTRCAGRTNNGSGKGMCQWGSNFWGTDQTYTWILNHYYGPDTVTIQSPAALVATSPATKTSELTPDTDNLRLSPNPVSGSDVKVTYLLKEASQAATITLTNHYGSMVRQQRVMLQQGHNQLTLPTGKLKAGLYTVTIRLQTGKTTSKKLMATE